MLEQFLVNMPSLQKTRKVSVFLPTSYDTSSKTYPVLYMPDGQNLFVDEEANFGVSWGVKNYLEETGLELIVVGIHSPTDRFERFNEYGPWIDHQIKYTLFGENGVLGGDAPAFADDLIMTVKPLIDSRYRTNPEITGFAGSSMGGLLATYIACMYPTIFSRIGALSSAYWFNEDDIFELVEQVDLKGIHSFYMDVGTDEETATIDAKTYVDVSKRMHLLIDGKDVPLQFSIYDEGIHHESAWKERVPSLIHTLFQDVL
ncbi:hypothetical protein Q73_03765 [Bacillus coahuilensis m2-6]|uniref:Carbohydrate esterase n=1 Tax=Bacillus coahuilensis p1.1.43 TaxID=1150625 RepID=A0A147KAI2_9BACI|nr:alpha/beta hydrolase-fold protein [Bacillus coahuilensis]KUP07736.1 hypothetical protein Q75_04345 [Bacillus coahuilensis p1.1.43]KUP09033.1 hypothetical protein Q73_03765 [Bacillus coahuilensis m2-6]